MGAMRELLDRRLMEHRWEMWEVLGLVDKNRLEAKIRVRELLNKIERLEKE